MSASSGLRHRRLERWSFADRLEPRGEGVAPLTPRQFGVAEIEIAKGAGGRDRADIKARGEARRR